MTAMTIERPSIDVSIERPTGKASHAGAVLPANDMRRVGLIAAGRRLGMQSADLGPVVVRRAKADLVHCPICPGH